MRSLIIRFFILLGLLFPALASAIATLDTARYLPHTTGNQWAYINDNYNTMTNNFGSPVTLPSGVVAIPWTRVDSNTCISSCVTYNTFDASGWLRYQEYIGSVYISGYGNTSATSVFTPALSFAPANVTIGSTYTSTGAVTITYTNVTTVSLNYSSTTQIVGFETVSNNAGTQLWSALKVILSTTMSGTVNGQFRTITSASTYWLVDGLGMVKAYAPNASGVMETWKLTSTNVVIPKASQAIGAISFSPTSLVVGGTTTANASATSGLTISFSSTNPSICTVSGSTVTGIAVGACTIAANQVGDASYNAASQVTRGIAINSTSTMLPTESVEFYHADIDHYFMTASLDEAVALDNKPEWGWTRTGKTSNVWLTQASAPGNASPVCRFFGVFANGTVGSHFYTVDSAECEYVKGRLDWGWNYEGDAFYAVKPVGGSCPSGTSPVYRVFNNGMGGAPNHRYMTNQADVATMVSQGWITEGTAFCGAL